MLVPPSRETGCGWESRHRPRYQCTAKKCNDKSTHETNDTKKARQARRHREESAGKRS